MITPFDEDPSVVANAITEFRNGALYVGDDPGEAVIRFTTVPDPNRMLRDRRNSLMTCRHRPARPTPLCGRVKPLVVAVSADPRPVWAGSCLPMSRLPPLPPHPMAPRHCHVPSRESGPTVRIGTAATPLWHAVGKPATVVAVARLSRGAARRAVLDRHACGAARSVCPPGPGSPARLRCHGQAAFPRRRFVSGFRPTTAGGPGALPVPEGSGYGVRRAGGPSRPGALRAECTSGAAVMAAPDARDAGCGGPC